MKMSLQQLNAIVASYVNSQKQAGAWVESRDNLIGLLDKVGKITTLDGVFFDPLTEMDGDNLPLGKTIEEWYQDLVLPMDFDRTGANTLAPLDPTYRPVSYSYSLGTKTFKTTLRYNEYDRAMNSTAELATAVSMVTKRLVDSEQTFKYDVKKQLIGNAISKVESAISGASSYVQGTQYAVGTYVKSGDEFGVVVTKIETADNLTWANAKANGYVNLLDLKKVVAKPVDTDTGEAFIKAMINTAEDASYINSAHNLNGAVMGAEEGLVVYCLKGIKSVLDVDVLAGAFHRENVAMPMTIKYVDSFGNYAGNAFAIAVDSRGLKLHSAYQATRDQSNGAGNFINYYRHTEFTAFISRNTFIRVFETA